MMTSSRITLIIMTPTIAVTEVALCVTKMLLRVSHFESMLSVVLLNVVMLSVVAPP